MMNRRFYFPLFFALAAIATAFPAAHAQWVPNGVAVCTAYQHQGGPEIIADGEGGAIMTWHDSRVYYDVYAQRLDPYGVPLWTADGVVVAATIYSQYLPQIASDGAGGAIIVWQDNRGGNWDIYAQRLNGDGVVLWTANGTPICTVSGDQEYPQIISDGAGGAVIVWEDNRAVGSTFDIYAQRIDATGAALWTPDGVEVCVALEEQRYPQLAADGSGGAIITWQDFRGGTAWDIYAARINSSGSAWWILDGVVICSATNDQTNVRIASDAHGGAVVVWQDNRGGNTDIYAQRVTYDGSVQWAANGVSICNEAQSQIYPEIASDGSGEPIIVWQDPRTGISYDVYAQKLDLFGVAQWTLNGIAVCTAPNSKYYPKIACDGTGGAVFAWQDRRYNSSVPDIFAQKISAAGGAVWQSNGVPVCTAIHWQQDVAIASDGTGGAVIIWEDWRSEVYTDLFAQRVDRYGNWGYPAPAIESVRDVPGDQGGFVSVQWRASRLDPFPYESVNHYSIWRAISPASATALFESGAFDYADIAAREVPLLCGSNSDASVGHPIIRIDRTAAETFYWELLMTAEAQHLDSYSKTVATLFDSTAICDELHYFQIIAHAYAGGEQYWISAPDSGYSVDNLAPCPPLALAGEQSYVPAGLSLTWARNDEPDLDCYHVYRGTDEGFVPGPGNMLAAPCDTAYFDGTWDWSAGYWYKVAAVDVHGNESAYAVLGPDGVTGEETPTAPAANYLAQNYPNPFNPVTRIEYGLAAPAEVRLRIYDAAGRLVRVLVNEVRTAARHVELWDGRDGRGAAVASGIYFYRLDAGAFTETRKIVLLR
jgi:hypothetical protein